MYRIKKAAYDRCVMDKKRNINSNRRKISEDKWIKIKKRKINNAI